MNKTNFHPTAVLPSDDPTLAVPGSAVPDYAVLEHQLAESRRLIDDVILKNYLSKLSDMEVIPLDDSLMKISDIRIFKITEMVYQNNEYSTYKFASVFNSVQNLNCSIFVIAQSDGRKTDFYMGIRSLDDKRTAKSLKDTLRNSLCGQFPGVKTEDLLESDTILLLDSLGGSKVASVSCVAKNKDEDLKENDTFLQGLDKLALTMQGQKYTAIILAKSTPGEQLAEMRRAYEAIYTNLSPFANMQISYSTNTALSVSDAFSQGSTTGTSQSTSTSRQTGSSKSQSTGTNRSVSKPDPVAQAAKIAASTLLNVIGGPGAGNAIAYMQTNTYTEGTSTTDTSTSSESHTSGQSESTSRSSSETSTKTRGITTGKSDTMQLTMQNKALIDTLSRIDEQLKRLDECESLGMWECAAYFLSGTQETAEMAAGTYKALISGDKSGVEQSSINFWGKQKPHQVQLLNEYLRNFIHPEFQYRSDSAIIPVTASTMISGNELAIQMGLPRKSVCGFPVIEHSDFGKEIVRYQNNPSGHNIMLGQIYSMGRTVNIPATLGRDSLTMHTFITGSTGSGKSNTVYEILDQLRHRYAIPFMVIEPAKGEYKNIFGQFPDVHVFGTNPNKFDALLRLNPFRFPKDIHVLEHLDRLVEIFNVCWPMYAAMPAILKEAMERAYVAVGWDLCASVNAKGNKFPCFADLLEQIERVIAESAYSSDSKGDYTGALLTRVRTLTTGMNSLLFTQNDLADEELFDQSVIVDLSRIGSSETKALIMGILLLKLNEHRMTKGAMNRELSHITVLEEAHHLLRRTSTEQSSESANLLGKSVEMLTNSIAEMRTYGEGFIIADQSPGLLDLSVIRNTNTKIILRLPEKSDRELVGYAANLNDDQITELAKLECGVAAVYQNDWVEPVLMRINKCEIHEALYIAHPDAVLPDKKSILSQIVNLLIQGHVTERLDFSIDEIEAELETLGLSRLNAEFIEEQIAEYRETQELELWADDHFKKLARRITDILGVRAQVENFVLHAADDAELTAMLEKIACQILPESITHRTMALCQCFMKDMSCQQEEAEMRQKIYENWFAYMKRGRYNHV